MAQTTKINLEPAELNELRIMVLRLRRKTTVPELLARLARRFIAEQTRRGQANGAATR
jgi:hypothetical protein